MILNERREYAEAEAALARAIKGLPTEMVPREHLFRCFLWQGKPDDAEATVRAAMAVQRGVAVHHAQLAVIYLNRRRFSDAIIEGRKAVALKPDDTQARRLLEMCQRFADLHRNRPAVVAGTEAPRDRAETLDVAEYLTHFRDQPLRAVDLYRRAFADAGPPDDILRWHRINAARAAICAIERNQDGAGNPLAVAKAADLHAEARRWIADSVRALSLAAHFPLNRHFVAATCLSWKRHQDFFPVRDRAALDRLPAVERSAWQDVWAELHRTLDRIAPPN